MKYLTHILTLPHAQRERLFHSRWTQARESVTRLADIRYALVKACDEHLRSNYIDADALERCVRKIVTLSDIIRKLSRLPDNQISPNPLISRLSSD